MRLRVFVALVLVLGLMVSVVARGEDSSVVQGVGGEGLGSDLFDDVPVGHWADEEVGWAVTNGVMEGVGGRRFDLQGVVPRWQIAAFLYRASVLAGDSPVDDGLLGSASFVDVPVGHVADEEIGWAVAKRITVGVGQGRFDPDGSVTRAQIVTFLYRLTGLVGGPVGGGGLGSGSFVDIPVGHWADEEVGWAVANGITVGVGHGRFALNRVVTRAQIATFLFRVHRLVDESTSVDRSTVPVEVAGVDLTHVDEEKVRVSIGLEDPVAVGGEMMGAARLTGLAVARDGDGKPQGMTLVIKVDEPVSVRINYLTTAAALVYMTPGIANSNPLLTLATMWVLSDLDELEELAVQLEADAIRLGNSYLVNLSSESTQALRAAVQGLGRALSSSSGSVSSVVPRSYGFSVDPGEQSLGGRWVGSVGLAQVSQVADRRDPCVDQDSEAIWDRNSSAVGKWDPTGHGIEQNDGVCIRGNSELMVGKNHAWTAVAAPMQRGDNGIWAFGDSYVLLSSDFVAFPNLFDILVALWNNLKCEALESIEDWDFLGDWQWLMQVVGEETKDCPNLKGWARLFDVIRGGEFDLTVEMMGDDPKAISRFALIKAGWAGPNPYTSHEDLFVVKHLQRYQRTANIYQGIHLTVPLITIISDAARDAVLAKVEAWFKKYRGGAATRLNGLRERLLRVVEEVAQKPENTWTNIERRAFKGAIESVYPETTLAQWLTVLIDALINGDLEDLAEELGITALIDGAKSGQFNVDVIAEIVLSLAEIALIATAEVLIEKAAPVVGQINLAVDAVSAAGTLALTGEQWGYESLSFYATGVDPIASEDDDVDFVLVLDASGSMAEYVREGRKIDIAVDAITKTYETVRDEIQQRAEVLVFQAEAGIGGCNVPSIRSAVDGWRKAWEPAPRIRASGATPTGRALQAAMFMLGYVDESGRATGSGSGEIVLVSDGLSNCVPDPCRVVQDANTPVIVHTVGFLLADDDTAAERELKCIAEVTGGRSVTVQEASETVDVIRPIVREQKVVHHARNVPEGFTETYSWWWFTDRDGDGIPDKWEKDGVYRSTWELRSVGEEAPKRMWVIKSEEPLNLKERGAHPDRKDLFVYYDWEEGADVDQEVFDIVERAFADAPFDRGKGIAVHFIPGKEIPSAALPEATYLSGLGGLFETSAAFSGFDQSIWAGYSRRAGLPQLAKYLLIRHPCDEQGCPFGQALSVPGNFGVVFMGGDTWCQSIVNAVGDCWLDRSKASSSGPSAKTHVQAANMMHVLGHMLGLRHHGAENCPRADPAYSSIMSYAYTAIGIEEEFGVFLVDYSRDNTVNLDWSHGLFGARTKIDKSCAGTATEGSTNDGSITFILNQYGEDPDFYIRNPVNLSVIGDTVTLHFGLLNTTTETNLATLFENANPEDLMAFAEFFDLGQVPQEFLRSQ